MSWIDNHHRVATFLGIFALLVALTGLGVTVYLNGDQNARFDNAKAAAAAAQQASNARIDPVVCHLVYAYVNPVAGTDQTHRADQIDLAWRQVGRLVGCPGIK